MVLCCFWLDLMEIFGMADDFFGKNIVEDGSTVFFSNVPDSNNLKSLLRHFMRHFDVVLCHYVLDRV